jgi:hypothetical protein
MAAGDLHSLLRLYDPEAVFLNQSGEVKTGEAGLREVLAPFYYPGSTIGGVSEPAGMLLTIVWLFMTPFGSTTFWLTLVALLCLLAQQAVYWFVTHPVNQFWVEGRHINRLGAGFFSFGTPAPRAVRPDWRQLRDRWEYSHVARAGLTLVSITALVIALSAS